MTFTMRNADKAASGAEALIRSKRLEETCHVLDPFAFGRTKFPILDRIGARLGQSTVKTANLFAAFDQMVSRGAVGYYVIVGSALTRRLRSNMPTCMKKTARYITVGNHWAKCDAIAERVWGAALVEDFDQAYNYLETVRSHKNRWIRRGVGVAVHYYAKKRGNDVSGMRKLLNLLGPVIEERNRDAVKGIGWGLKTIGKYQPRLLAGYLRIQMKQVYPTKLMLRKATTYLPASAKREIIGLHLPRC